MGTTTKLRLRELLVERRLTTKFLAERTGLSESYLTHLKNGTRRWNEDTLSKLAEAFDLNPVDLFVYRTPMIIVNEPDQDTEQTTDSDVHYVPLVRLIPSQPRYLTQPEELKKADYTGINYPVMQACSSSTFCLQVRDSSMDPECKRGDVLVIDPGAWSRSGDTVAIEFEPSGQQQRIIARVFYSDAIIVVEQLGNKHFPVPIVRSKDAYRIIGKVIARYQKY